MNERENNMKKISAILLSLIMTCSMLASCGSNDDSSKSESKDAKESVSSAAEESKADESKADDESAADEESKADEESTADEESKADVNTDGGELAKAYTDKLNSGTFEIDMTISSSLLGDDTPCSIAVKDGNYKVSLTMMGIAAEMYIVDGKAYTLMPDAQLYQTMDDIDINSLGVDTFALDDGAEYVETTEEDGYTVETYNIPVSIDAESGVEVDNSSSLTTETKYYFDSNGDLKKITTSGDISGDTTVTIDSLKFDDVEDIVMPDISDWTEMTDDAELDEETQMKLSLSMLGVTEEALTEAGYTYAQLAEMDDEEIMAVLEELGVSMDDILN